MVRKEDKRGRAGVGRREEGLGVGVGSWRGGEIGGKRRGERREWGLE